MAKRSSLPFLKFIFHAFKFFGVATFKIDQNFNFECSKPGLAYNVFLIIVVLINTYFGVYASYFDDIARRVQLEKIADTVHTLLLIFSTLFILIVYCIRQEEIIKIANELRRSVDVSSTLCCKKTYDVKSNKVVKELKIIILLNVITTIIWIVTTPTSPMEICLYFVCVTICNFIINALMIQYTVVMTLIAHLFEVLNTSLMEITNFKTEHLETTFLQTYGIQTKLKKLTQYRDFFTSLNRVSREISIFMDLLILACIVNVFVILTMYSYYAMKIFVVDKDIIPMPVLIHDIVQLSFTIITTIFLVRAGSLAVNQSKRTGEIVNECMHDEGFPCHPDVANQLNRFSNYLLHTNVQFGVCNLFTLNESLLLSIAGSITTYLVILVQFKQSNVT